MKSSIKKNSAWLLLIAVCSVLVYGVVTKLVSYNTESVRVELQLRSEQQLQNIVVLADATKQNVANASAALVVKDCAADKRKQFDLLLDKLSATISPVELETLTNLFYQCGNFYAQQRALMSLQLTREVVVLKDLVSLVNVIATASSTLALDAKKWEDIAVAEAKIAAFFSQLVNLQGLIITSLGSGKTPQSPEVTAALTEVAKVRGQMVVLSKQIEDERAALSSI